VSDGAAVTAWGIAKAAWAFLTSPLGRALLLLAIFAGLAWWALSAADQRGYDRATAEQAAAVAQAQADQRAAEIARDNLAAAIADATEARARDASAQTQQASQRARERIRTVIREVPADCPAEVPQVALDELQRAIDFANKANQ
jgi:parvulin-like peptidyl-prolyl isomerase